jgi:hypothetical protein
MSSTHDPRPGSWRALVEHERKQAREYEASCAALQTTRTTTAAVAQPILGPWPTSRDTVGTDPA